MNDKYKHFLACLTIALVGFTHSTFAGLYGATLCAFLREYGRWNYTEKLDKLEGFSTNINWPNIPEV